MQQLDLTSAIAADRKGGGTTYWKPVGVNLQLGVTDAGVIDSTRSYIVVNLLGQNSERLVCKQSGQAAHDNIVALNKANLTSNSLQKRALDLFVTLGQVAGTVSGTPD